VPRIKLFVFDFLRTGLVNMTALGNVINWQRLDYDFNFHQQPFHTDIVMLIISEGKSILKVCEGCRTLRKVRSV